MDVDKVGLLYALETWESREPSTETDYTEDRKQSV
jgi:hypothetical protein